MSFDALAIVEVVKVLRHSDIYKRMTTHGNHRMGRDVYRPSMPAGQVYLNFTVVEEVLIVSFQEF